MANGGAAGPGSGLNIGGGFASSRTATPSAANSSAAEEWSKKLKDSRLDDGPSSLLIHFYHFIHFFHIEMWCF